MLAWRGGIFDFVKNNSNAASGTIKFYIKHIDYDAVGMLEGGGSLMIARNGASNSTTISGITTTPYVIDGDKSFSFSSSETSTLAREIIFIKLMPNIGFGFGSTSRNVYKISEYSGGNVPEWAEYYVEIYPANGGTIEIEFDLYEESWASKYASTSTWQGNGTNSSPYLISSEGDLALLAKNVNAGNDDYADKYFKQTKNLNMNAHVWDGIGWSSSKCFLGTYDGNGYKISGLHTLFTSINSNVHKYKDNKGLFGYVSFGGGVFKNITVTDSYIKGESYVGGIIGYFRTSSGGDAIVNCKTENVSVYGVNEVGGILGRFEDYDSTITIKNCISNGNVKGNNYIGGIVGYVKMNGPGDYNARFTGCINNSNVNGSSYVGGIVGGGYTRFIENCISRGVIQCDTAYVGGIIGYHFNKRMGDSIQNCAIYGSIFGNVGGIFVGGEELSGESYATLSISKCSFIGYANSSLMWYCYPKEPNITNNISGCYVKNGNTKYYSSGDFSGYTVVSGMNEDLPMQNQLFNIALGGQTSSYIINYLRSLGFALIS